VVDGRRRRHADRSEQRIAPHCGKSLILADGAKKRRVPDNDEKCRGTFPRHSLVPRLRFRPLFGAAFDSNIGLQLLRAVRDADAEASHIRNT